MSNRLNRIFLFFLFVLGVKLCANSIEELKRLTPKLSFHGTGETLNKIKSIIERQEKGIYLRFGDGEINIATGGYSGSQVYHPRLSAEVRKILSMNGENIIKSLPLHCRGFGYCEEGMFPGNHEIGVKPCLSILRRAKHLWGAEIVDVYSPVALHFYATYKAYECIRFLKFLKKKNCYLLVGNRNIPKHIRDLLFGENCKFVPTPPRNAYNEIDRVMRESLNAVGDDEDYKIIVTAMGVSGKVIQKLMWDNFDNIFLFDFGSLIDALCGWSTRAWIELTNFNNEMFLDKLRENIKIVCTSALIEKNFEERKDEYIRSLSLISKYGYEPYIIEAVKKIGSTFLEDYTSHVFYPGVNDISLKNKGVNEARSLIEGLKFYDFDEHDMLIKLTGRYLLEDDYLMTIISENPGVDAVVKLDIHGQVFTGCFALRCRYFKEMLNGLDLDKMEKYMINIEREVANYISKLEKSGGKVMYLDKLGIAANIFGQGESYSVDNLTYL